MTDFGAGVFLTQDLDFEVTNTGDIRTTRGTSELEKDMAIQSIVGLTEFGGRKQTPQTRARLRARVTDILIADPRINDVVSVDVRFKHSTDTVILTTGVRTDSGEQELVFEV